MRQWVEDARTYAENKDRSALMDMVSDAYADGRGNDAAAIEKMLRVIFLRTHTISLLSTIEEIKVDAGSAAEILLTVGMLETGGGALGLDADAYRFHLELENDGDEWLLIGARYGKLGGDLR